MMQWHQCTPPSRQQKMPILTLCLVLFQEFYPPAPSTRGSLEFAPLAAVSNQTDQCSPSAPLALETAIGPLVMTHKLKWLVYLWLRWSVAATISAMHCPIPDLMSDFFASTITIAGASTVSCSGSDWWGNHKRHWVLLPHPHWTLHQKRHWFVD